jgi:hypothetical protein
MNGLEEHLQEEINSSLVSIEALEEMSTATQKQLSSQGIGPYQRAYMRRWAQWVRHGHEKKYHKLRAQNEELRQELRSIRQCVEDLGAHLRERQH